MKSSDTRDPVSVIDAAPSNVRYLTSRRARREASFDLHPLSAGSVRGSAVALRGEGFEFNALPDAVLLGWLTAKGHRPNVLIECSAASADTAMRHLMTWCSLPFRYCALPGGLELPNPARGTLLLKDVAALTLSQQVRLYDWLTVVHGQVQVISLTSVPLASLVEDGEFLEGLLYRLNVIRIDGVTGTRPAPLDAWQTV